MKFLEDDDEEVLPEDFVKSFNKLCNKHNFFREDMTNELSYLYYNKYLWMYEGKTQYDLPCKLNGRDFRISPTVQFVYDNWAEKFFVKYDEIEAKPSRKTGLTSFRSVERNSALRIKKFDWTKFENWLIKQNELVQLSIQEAKKHMIQDKLDKIESDFN